MKIEAIIIDGKKYVPIKGKRCEHCAFNDMLDVGDDCFVYETSDTFISACDLFKNGCVLQEVKDEQPKNK